MKKILFLVCLLSSLSYANCEYYEKEFFEARERLKAVISNGYSLAIAKEARANVLYYASNSLIFCDDKETWSDIVEYYGEKYE